MRLMFRRSLVIVVKHHCAAPSAIQLVILGHFDVVLALASRCFAYRVISLHHGVYYFWSRWNSRQLVGVAIADVLLTDS
jgi:hypothetical protein